MNQECEWNDYFCIECGNHAIGCSCHAGWDDLECNECGTVGQWSLNEVE